MPERRGVGPLLLTNGERSAHFVRLPPQPSDAVLLVKGGGHASAVLRPALGTSFTYCR
jgi:hypothetical protein